MADFDRAFEKTSIDEGGYVNDPDDRGGETYRGVARRHHPGWSGWRIIDRLSRRRGFPANLARDTRLQRAVKDLYRAHYWDRIKGDAMPNNAIAEEIFNTAVNMGVPKAGRFLQEGLNLLNRNEKSYPDIVVDGWIGPKTLRTVKRLLAGDRTPKRLLRLLNVLQGMAYIEIVRRDPSQERFIRGWLARTE